jgi:ribosome-associated protein
MTGTVQRVSPAEHIVVDSRLAIPLAEIELRASRSSGPGGQHANVTASRIEAVFDVEASQALSDEQKRRIRQRCGPRVTAVAQDARSQARNRDLALERLGERLAKALHRPKARRRTKPGRAAKERRLAAKRRRGETKRLRQAPPGD